MKEYLYKADGTATSVKEKKEFIYQNYAKSLKAKEGFMFFVEAVVQFYF